MRNKKLIISTVSITLVFILVIFLTIKTSSYLVVKNNCIQNNSKLEGYSVSLSFKPTSSQSSIDIFTDEIRKMTGVKNVQSKTKDEALQEFIKNQGSNPEILKAVNELGTNPLSSSIIVNSSINNIDDFLKFKQGVLDEAKNSGLEIVSHYDGNLIILQKEIAKVRNASLIRDLPGYLFSGEGNHFFEKKYSQICNPNFPRK